MRIAHVILAHKNPTQIERLIKAMHHSDSDFYIHIDKKVAITDFQYLTKLPQVSFIKKRITCNWGGFSLVESMLASIDQINETSIKYDFINLCSGQDYPIKPINEIHSFFNKNLGYSFLSYEKSKMVEWWLEADKRYTKYHFTDVNFKLRYAVQNILNKFLPDRKLPVDIELYGGNKACWWTISYDSAIYLSAYFKKNPKLSRFLKYTWGCDEFIIVSLLMNSPFKDKVINENYRYIDWSSKQAHPRTLNSDDFEKLTSSEMFFARKFDIKLDAEILEKIDNFIVNN